LTADQVDEEGDGSPEQFFSESLLLQRRLYFGKQVLNRGHEVDEP